MERHEDRRRYEAQEEGQTYQELAIAQAAMSVDGDEAGQGKVNCSCAARQ